MAQVTVRLDENVRVGFDKFGKAIPKITRKQINSYATKTRKAIAGGYSGGNTYRVELPPSGRNVRTGRYGQSVTYEMPDYSRVVFSNAAYRKSFNYGRLLTGYGDGSGQAWWARGRWPIMRDEVEKGVKPFIAEYDDELQAGIEAAGL